MPIDCQPQLHMVAIHAQAGYRDAVPGLAVLCVKDQTEIISVGAYQNSLGAPSQYAVGGRYLGQVGSVRFGFIAGIVNGYPVGNGDYIPMAAAVASVGLWGQTLHMTIVPPVEKYSPALVQLSISFK